MAHRAVHRHDDKRVCGARTRAQCNNVRVNYRWISIQDDPNSHRNGNLIATITVGKVHAFHKPVILIHDPARADNLCPGDSHCNPKASTASPDVRAGNTQ